MEVLGVIREKVSEIAVSAVKKSGELVESVKVNFSIVDKEAEINKLLKEMGKAVYVAYKESETFPADEVATYCAEIDKLYEEISDNKAKLSEMKSTKTCPSCGSGYKEEFNFCPSCGKNVK